MSKAIQNRIVHDEELIVRLQRGDEWAFQLLIRRFRNQIFSIAFGITLDARESRDIVADVFFRVYREILNFKGDASLSTWLQRITVSQCLDWKRRWARRFPWFRKRGRDEEAIDDDGTGKDPVLYAECSDNAQARQLIDQTLKKLSIQTRTIYTLRELENLSYEDIAYITGGKVEMVRSRLFQARRQLKALSEPVTKEAADK